MVRWQIAAAVGLAASVLVTGLALVAETDRIEADLQAKAAAVLAPETFEWARTTVVGRDVTIEGLAPTEGTLDLAVAALERQFGVRVVDAGEAGLLPEVTPYRVTLSRDGGSLTIAGAAPSGPDKRRLVEALTRAVPNLAYNDDLVLGRGMPERGFLEAVTGLMPLLGEIRRGSVTVTDTAVAIEGEAISNAAYDALTRADPAVADGFSITAVDLVRPRAEPFRYAAIRDEAGVALAGFAPDRATMDRLFAVARAGAAQRPVRQAVDLASGAPDGFADAATGSLDFLDLMASGRVDVVGDRIAISGVAATPEAYRTLVSHLSTFAPRGFTVETSIDLPVVKPFILTVSRSGPKVGASGFAPSEATVAAIRTAVDRVAGLGGGVVETTVANGAPERFEDAATFAIALLDNVAEGSVVIADDRILLSGTAATGSDLLEIDAAIAVGAPEGFTVETTVAPPRIEAYTWTLARDAEQFSISGYVPSEDIRLAVRGIVETAAGDLGVADRTSLASGLPAGIRLAAVATFAARALADLDEGSATLDGDRLSLTGRTGDAVAAARIRAALADALPDGVAAGTVAIEAPNLFQFRAERGLDAVVIEGRIPDEAAKAAVEAQVGRLFAGADVEMALAVTDGLPDGAAGAIAAALRGVSLLATGSAVIDGPVLRVAGKAFTGTGAVRVSSDLAGALPDGFQLETAVGVAPPPARTDAAGCQAAFDGVLGRATILFDSGDATIAADSHGLLDRLGAIALSCPDTRIAVEGHTDAEGDAAANQALSERRAAAVAAVLESVGVARDRLDVAGFGAERPVADNATEAGRAANRRIAFRTLPPPAAPAPGDPAPGDPAPRATDPATPADPATAPTGEPQ